MLANTPTRSAFLALGRVPVTNLERVKSAYVSTWPIAPERQGTCHPRCCSTSLYGRLVCTERLPCPHRSSLQRINPILQASWQIWRTSEWRSETSDNIAALYFLILPSAGKAKVGKNHVQLGKSRHQVLGRTEEKGTCPHNVIIHAVEQ